MRNGDGLRALAQRYRGELRCGAELVWPLFALYTLGTYVYTYVLYVLVCIRSISPASYCP